MSKIERGKDFPLNDEEFFQLFSSNKACMNYIKNYDTPEENYYLEVETYWPWFIGKKQLHNKDGTVKVRRSVCPVCRQNIKPYPTARGYRICRNKLCQFTISITAVTFFRDKNKILKHWFRAIWLMICVNGQISIEDFKSELGLRSSHTARMWINSIRELMGKSSCSSLSSKSKHQG